MKLKKGLSKLSKTELISIIEDLYAKLDEALARISVLEIANAKLQADNLQLKVENAQLRTELAQSKEKNDLLTRELIRAKKLTPKPKITPSRLGKKERKNSKKSRKGSKNLVPSNTVILTPENLLEGAKLKGYEDYYEQDLIIQPKVTLYRRAKYQLPDGTCVTASLPKDVEGHFGPGIKKFIIQLHYESNASQHRIRTILLGYEIQISEGQINNILLEYGKRFEEEYKDIYEAGKEVGSFLATDDTGHIHQGKRGFTTVIRNDFFVFFKSSNNKSRLNFLTILRGSHKDHIINDVALDYIKGYKPKPDLLNLLNTIKDVFCQNEDEWEALLKEVGIDSIASIKMLQIIKEASILGSAITHGLNPKNPILSDGARQFMILIHALCWIHAERAIKKLLPKNDDEAQEINKILDQLWDYYKRLKAYQENPNQSDKQALVTEYDDIFGQSVTNLELVVVLENFISNKEQLLIGLNYTDVPLHNNACEQAIRIPVGKRSVSSGTRTDEGRNVRDIMMSILATCRLLKISFALFLEDRIKGSNKIPKLGDYIRQKAKTQCSSNLGPPPIDNTCSSSVIGLSL